MDLHPAAEALTAATTLAPPRTQAAACSPPAAPPESARGENGVAPAASREQDAGQDSARQGEHAGLDAPSSKAAKDPHAYHAQYLVANRAMTQAYLAENVCHVCSCAAQMATVDGLSTAFSERMRNWSPGSFAIQLERAVPWCTHCLRSVEGKAGAQQRLATLVQRNIIAESGRYHDRDRLAGLLESVSSENGLLAALGKKPGTSSRAEVRRAYDWHRLSYPWGNEAGFWTEIKRTQVLTILAGRTQARQQSQDIPVAVAVPEQAAPERAAAEQGLADLLVGQIDVVERTASARPPAVPERAPVPAQRRAAVPADPVLTGREAAGTAQDVGAALVEVTVEQGQAQLEVLLERPARKAPTTASYLERRLAGEAVVLDEAPVEELFDDSDDVDATGGLDDLFDSPESSYDLWDPIAV